MINIQVVLFQEGKPEITFTWENMPDSFYSDALKALEQNGWESCGSDNYLEKDDVYIEVSFEEATDSTVQEFLSLVNRKVRSLKAL